MSGPALKSITLPPVQTVSADQARKLLHPGDSLLFKLPTSFAGKFIYPGQSMMLRQFGYDAQTTKTLAHFVHAAMLLKSGGLAIEATWPKVRYVDVIEHYAGVDILVLRPRPLTGSEVFRLEAMAQDWCGVTYDWREYLIYPFYMAWGWSPRWWARLWDKPDKPVCSGLCVRLYRECMEIMYDVPVQEQRAWPPARLPLHPDLAMAYQLRITPESTPSAAQLRRYPWWLKSP